MAKKNNKRVVEIALKKKLAQSQEIYKDKKFLKGLATEVAEGIKKRTQLGKGTSDSGSLTKLKALGAPYKKTRKKFRSNLDQNTTPNKSNLTATGQMLNALRGKYRNKSIQVDFEKERRSADIRGYKGKATNSDIVGYQEDQGREFFNVSETEQNSIRRKIANRIKKLLEK